MRASDGFPILNLSLFLLIKLHAYKIFLVVLSTFVQQGKSTDKTLDNF